MNEALENNSMYYIEEFNLYADPRNIVYIRVTEGKRFWRANCEPQRYCKITNRKKFIVFGPRVRKIKFSNSGKWKPATIHFKFIDDEFTLTCKSNKLALREQKKFLKRWRNSLDKLENN